MVQRFFVFGYGVPKDIRTDDNYQRYLSVVFNAIYTVAAGRRAAVVFCGGTTDCIRAPYSRTEAGEMKKLFLHLTERSFVRKQASDWQYSDAGNTLSTLENVIFAAEKSRGAQAVIFCEKTRARRIRTLARRAFGRRKVAIIPVDFDMSASRYLDAAFLARRERHDLRHELMALVDKKKRAEWRAYHKKKLAFFRSHEYGNNPSVVMEWWKKQQVSASRSVRVT